MNSFELDRNLIADRIRARLRSVSKRRGATKTTTEPEGGDCFSGCCDCECDDDDDDDDDPDPPTCECPGGYQPVTMSTSGCVTASTTLNYDNGMGKWAGAMSYPCTSHPVDVYVECQGSGTYSWVSDDDFLSNKIQQVMSRNPSPSFRGVSENNQSQTASMDHYTVTTVVDDKVCTTCRQGDQVRVSFAATKVCYPVATLTQSRARRIMRRGYKLF